MLDIDGGQQLRVVAFCEHLIVKRTTLDIALLPGLKHILEEKFEQVPHLPNGFFHLGQPRVLEDEANSVLWFEARQEYWS